ncbi:MAG TPA: hypothetical protein VFK32_07210, partial [Tepidiformaceae bacterium]|nr:hypothetical protein [Tepidiformaceae bacterium]
FNFSFPDPDGAPDQQTSSVAQSTYAECAETSGYSVANLAYSDALGRPSATDVDAAYDRIGACLASGGPDDPEPNAMRVFFGFEGHRDLTERTFGLDWSDAEAVEAYVQCSLAEEAVSGITAPDPGPPNR